MSECDSATTSTPSESVSVCACGDVVLEGNEQERPEAASRLVRLHEVFAFNQPFEKSLSEVERVVGVETGAARVGVDGLPIRGTELLERRRRRGRFLRAG